MAVRISGSREQIRRATKFSTYLVHARPLVGPQLVLFSASALESEICPLVLILPFVPDVKRVL